MALLKVTLPKNKEPVTNLPDYSQHDFFFCFLYFCRTSLRLGECAFFCTFAFFLNSFSKCMDTISKAWRKTWIQAVPHFTSSLQVLNCNEKKKEKINKNTLFLKLWNSWLVKYSNFVSFYIYIFINTLDWSPLILWLFLF